MQCIFNYALCSVCWLLYAVYSVWVGHNWTFIMFFLTFTVENYASTVQQRPKWNPALEQIKFNGMTISAAAAF